MPLRAFRSRRRDQGALSSSPSPHQVRDEFVRVRGAIAKSSAHGPVDHRGTRSIFVNSSFGARCKHLRKSEQYPVKSWKKRRRSPQNASEFHSCISRHISEDMAASEASFSRSSRVARSGLGTLGGRSRRYSVVKYLTRCNGLATVLRPGHRERQGPLDALDIACAFRDQSATG